ncbi:MAG TPA: GDP-mannose 4,6-dehydratase [Planctomycetota bacterium]|nr:GDP-mannose 4,6-dehydratase [Planctomycetota bacterium]
MSQNHALITGGAGFIGSHLAEHLLAAGWRVTAVDDLSTGSIANLRSVEGRPGFRLYVSSAGDEALLRALAADAHVVFHLAAVVGVKKVMESAIQTIEKNLHTTETVLKVANLFRLRTVVASTSEVYGANPRESFREDDDSIIGTSRHRRWSYAASKLLDEFHAFAYFYSTSLPVTVVRLFNTIGPRQVGHYGMVVPTFVGQALAGRPITVYGDGRQRRCFTFVKDVVRCLAELAARPATVGQVYNIGSDQEITIMDLARKVKAMTGSPSEVVLQSYQEVFGENFVDMERRKPDVSKLRAAIGYAPDTRLEAMLQTVIDELKPRG